MFGEEDENLETNPSAPEQNGKFLSITKFVRVINSFTCYLFRAYPQKSSHQFESVFLKRNIRNV